MASSRMALGGQFWHPRASGEELVLPLEVVLKQGPEVPGQDTEPTHRPGKLYSTWLSVHLFSPLPVFWCMHTHPPPTTPPPTHTNIYPPPHTHTSTSFLLSNSPFGFLSPLLFNLDSKDNSWFWKTNGHPSPLRKPRSRAQFSTCSLRAHTHRSLLGTSRRPLALSSATSLAPAGSDQCSQ